MSFDPETEQPDPLEETVSYTKWENEPSISDLKQNVDDARSDHDGYMAKLYKWRDNLRVEGSAVVKTPKGNSSYVPKLIRKQAEWRYPGLSEPFLANDEIFHVYPKTGKDIERARQNQLVLNYQFNTQIDKVAFVDEMVRAVVDEGTAIIRVGWETREEELTTSEPVYELVPDPTNRNAQRYASLAQMLEQDPERAEQFLNPGIKAAIVAFVQSNGLEAPIPRVVRYDEKTETIETENRPVLEVCDLDNLIVDPSCKGDLSKAQFICYEFETCLSDLKKSGTDYINLDRINLAAVSPQVSEDYSQGEDIQAFEFVDNPRKKFTAREYWGYWDIHGTGRTVPIVATWAGNTMIRLEENPYPDKGLPFVDIKYMPKKKSLFGEPDGELLSDNQKLMGALARGMIDLLAKSANSQTGMRKDLLDITNRRKFLRGENYEFNATADPRQAIYTHTFPEIPQSAYVFYNSQVAEAESLTGVKAFQDGLSGNSYGNVAAGIKGILDATSLRDSSILRRLISGMEKVARKIVAMNGEFLDDEEIIRITDSQFVTVRRDDLAGEFDFELNVSTPEEDNKRAEELSFMLQTIGNNVAPEILFMILADIARLRRMPRLAEKLENYQPKPDPLAERKTMIEMEEILSKIQENYAHAQQMGMASEHSRAKIVTEETVAILNQVKARLLGSQADREDLDFIEQESGVHQERELQKLGAQAAANTQMKIVESALRSTEPTQSRQ